MTASQDIENLILKKEAIHYSTVIIPKRISFAILSIHYLCLLPIHRIIFYSKKNWLYLEMVINGLHWSIVYLINNNKEVDYVVTHLFIAITSKFCRMTRLEIKCREVSSMRPRCVKRGQSTIIDWLITRRPSSNRQINWLQVPRST